MDLQCGLRLTKSKYGAKGKDMKDVFIVPRGVNNPSADEAEVGVHGNPTGRLPKPIFIGTKTVLEGTALGSTLNFFIQVTNFGLPQARRNDVKYG